MQYYIGVDIGTSFIKAIAFAQTGEVITKASRPTHTHHPNPGWAEQEADTIRGDVYQCIEELLAAMKAPPVFISFSAAMHSLIAVDQSGKPITPCIIWADNRAAAIAASLKDSETGKQLYRATGVPVHAMSPLSKICWWQQNHPAIIQQAYKLIGIKEYICYHLFGQYLVDTSIAAATGLLNMTTLQWEAAALELCGISASKLSGIVSAGHVMMIPAATTFSFTEAVPVIVGASDGALANIGTGATHANTLSVTIGTSAAVRLLVQGPYTDEVMRTFCYHVIHDQYIVGGASNNGAGVLQWLKECLLETTDSYDSLVKLADTVAPGSDGLWVLPYLSGERAPLWNEKARGVVFGLQVQHTRAHLLKAVLEGIIYNIYAIARVLQEKYTITEIRASGGFVQSESWLQLLADMFALPVINVQGDESAALGAVILGREALGIQEAFSAGSIQKTYLPNAANHAIYQEGLIKFTKLYRLLKEEMK